MDSSQDGSLIRPSQRFCVDLGPYTVTGGRPMGFTSEGMAGSGAALAKLRGRRVGRAQGNLSTRSS